MFNFEFCNNKTITIDRSSFPILLADIKAMSFYFKSNPTDTTQDDFIEDFIIPKIIFDWEKNTRYLLLDQTIKSFVPNIQYINSSTFELPLSALNVRVIGDVKSYPCDWNQTDAKTILDVSNYYFTEEVSTDPKKFKIKKGCLDLRLYPVTNNLEVEFEAGFEDNDFSTMDQEIKDCLSMQGAIAIDVKNGFCDSYYSELIEEIYTKYTIKKELISFI